MRRLKKRKKLSIKPIICITTIAMLNFIGVSYGVWSENLNLDFGITTGYIEPEFYLDDSKIVGNNKGELTLTLPKDNSDNRTVYISGEVYPGSSKNIFICIKNKGSIPVILDNIDVKKDDEIVKQLDNEKYFIDPGQQKDFKIHVHVKNRNNQVTANINDQLTSDDIQDLIDELNVTKEHTFKYKLQFKQGVK